MQKINENDSLEEYRKKMSHNRRIVLKARAAIQRAKDAGVPDKYLRINKQSFLSMLDPYYHKNPSNVANFVYDSPLDLLKKEFIIIDGGESIDRKKAAYAILFRLISCEKSGVSMINSSLVHKLQTLNKSLTGETRNDITENLRQCDLLLLMELQVEEFKEGFNTGRFYDEILSFRDDFVKTTILSFSYALSESASLESAKTTWADQVKFGQYVSLAGQSDSRKDERFFRIRVKKNG
jgi:hypothetical protein